MIYRNHQIKLFPPELVITLTDCPDEVIKYNDQHNKETAIGVIYGPKINCKIFLAYEGRNNSYKLLKHIVDDKLRKVERD